jgi:hypothetical protein
MAHSNGSGHTAGFVDHIDIDAQDFGHLGMDDAVAGIGAAAGPQTTTAVILRLGNPLAAMATPVATASNNTRQIKLIFFMSSSSLVNDL